MKSTFINISTSFLFVFFSQYALSASPIWDTCKSNGTKEPNNMAINLSHNQPEGGEIHPSLPYSNLMKVARPFREFGNKLNKEGLPCGAPNKPIITEMLHSAPSEFFKRYKGAFPSQFKFDQASDYTISIAQNHKACDRDGNKCAEKTFQCKANQDCHIDLASVSPPIKLKIIPKKNVCLKTAAINLPGGRCKNDRSFYAKSPHECSGKGGFESFAQLQNTDPNKVIFNPDYLKYLKPFGTLRAMNLMVTSPRPPQRCVEIMKKGKVPPGKNKWYDISSQAQNCILNGHKRTPDNRAKLSDLTWGNSAAKIQTKAGDTDTWKGAPIEVIAELANETGATPWIVLPPNATPAYVKEIATALKRKLKPGIKVKVEWCNECWNGHFLGSKMIEQLGRKNKLGKKCPASLLKNPKFVPKYCSSNKKGHQNSVFTRDGATIATFVEESQKNFDIFAKTFGDDSRLIRTMGAMQSDPLRTDFMLEVAKIKDKNLNKIESIATATYFWGCWERTKENQSYCGKKGYLKDAKSAKQVMDIINDPANKKGLPAVIEQIKKQRAAVEKHSSKISLSSYEGGQHLTLLNQYKLKTAEKKRLLKIFREANNSPAMKVAYDKLNKAWSTHGKGAHAHFTLAQTSSRWGNFGLTDHIYGSTSGKYESTKNYAKTMCSGSSGKDKRRIPSSSAK